MKIAILGTGGVGKAFAVRLSGLGHDVTLGTRDVNSSIEKLAEYLSQNAGIKVASHNDATTQADLVINALRGDSVLDVLGKIPKANLDGKVFIDISNPLDTSQGGLPTLIPDLCNTNSLGEEIQKRLPGTKVVKTLNTMWNGLMLNPNLIGNGDHINYLCGNDAEAKGKVTELLYEFGWKDESLLDLGDITNARGTEAILPIWLRVWGAKKTGAFNFRIVS